MKQVQEAENETKLVKALSLDGFIVECVKKCGITVLEWLVRLLIWSSTNMLVWCMYSEVK